MRCVALPSSSASQGHKHRNRAWLQHVGTISDPTAALVFHVPGLAVTLNTAQNPEDTDNSPEPQAGTKGPDPKKFTVTQPYCVSVCSNKEYL